jgi:hypothetical protein
LARRLIDPVVLKKGLRRARLWRDDLRQIAELIREVDPQCRIRTDRYELDEIDDLSGVEEARIATLRIRGSAGKVDLYLGKLISYISVEEPDHITRGMVAGVEDIVNRQRIHLIRTRSETTYIITQLSGCIASAAGLVLISFVLPDGSDFTDWQFDVSVGLILVGLLTFILVRPPGMIIYTRTRAEQPPWLKRNWDALVTNAIVSLVFLAIGIILGYLIT